MVLYAYQLTTTITHGGVKMFVKNFFKNLGEKIKNFLSKSKNFFENIWRETKNFFSKHKSVFQDIQKVLLVLLLIAFGILQLYQYSEILLMGLEENSTIGIAIAITGYFFVAGYTYWLLFHRSHNSDFRSLEYHIRDIRLQLQLYKANLSSRDFQIHNIGLDQKMFNLDLQHQLRKIERKLDELRVKEK